jgi:hypothetical protein
LAGGIPKGELDRLAVYSAVGDVVFEDGGDISLWSDTLGGYMLDADGTVTYSWKIPEGEDA